MKAYIIITVLALVILAGCAQRDVPPAPDPTPTPPPTDDVDIDEVIEDVLDDFVDEDDVELEPVI